MKQIDRIGAEILEELSDENIHTRSNILQHEKTMLRRDEESYIEFKCDKALSILVFNRRYKFHKTRCSRRMFMLIIK